MENVSGKRLLVVDDSKAVLAMMSGILMGLGFKHITLAESSKTALERANRIGGAPFDIIFLDRYLGGESGLEVLKAIRSRNKKIPIIMLTQEAEASRIIEAIEAGASDYIVKPFSAETISEKIERHLRIP